MSYQLILVDGSAFLFRAHFSTLSQALANKDGFPTGAIFGVLNAIKALQRQYPEAKIITIFDEKGTNFRHQIYPEYKAHRKPADEDLIIQIEPLYEIIKALGLHLLCIKGVEADDVIATLSKEASQHRIKTIIASNDKDLYQLVGDHVSQLDMKGNLLNYQGVIDRIGVRPDQIIDFLALTGDSADNIPGVPSVGPKTAVKWLQKYINIENLKKNANQITGKVGEKLRDNFDLLDLSYSLVQLQFDVELPCHIWDDDPGQDDEKLASFYRKYGFSMWLKQLETTGQPPNAVAKITDTKKNSENAQQNTSLLSQYKQHLILKDSDLNAFVARLRKASVFVFDLETNSLDYMNAEIVGLVFLIEKDSFYIPVAHDYLDAPQQLDRLQVLGKIKPILEQDDIYKIGQNLKYDAHVLANYNIQLRGISDDTMLKSYCLNSTATRHNMDSLSEYYLDHKTIHFSDVAGSGQKQISFNQVDLKQALPYACEDVIVTSELNQILEEKIKQYPQVQTLYKKLELPLTGVLIAMERNGVELDVGVLAAQQQDIIKQMRQIQARAFELADATFNLESPKQIQQVLFTEEGLGLKAKKKTPKGQPSTNEGALKLLDHPLVDLILNYRTLSKLNSTYLEALPKQINPNTKRLHTSYHQAVAATGRLSSSHPNLQNIPIRSEQGAHIRSAFVATQDNVIIAADYSQIELRIMAHISKDENLLDAFSRNIDVHSATASMMFNVPIEKVSKTQRRNAKAINFGLIYGMSAFGLARQINTSRTDAKAYIDAYFENYPGVLEYMNNTRKAVKEQGYVETITGRRLYLPEVNSKNNTRAQHALRAAINAPMQGSSADIIKQAMLNIHQWIINSGHDVKMIMQVHDELVFEINASQVDEFSYKIKQLMENAYNLTIPLIVDVGVGRNWQQAH